MLTLLCVMERTMRKLYFARVRLVFSNSESDCLVLYFEIINGISFRGGGGGGHVALVPVLPMK